MLAHSTRRAVISALIAVGLYLALAPVWTDTDPGAATALVTMGALIVCTALWALAQQTGRAGQTCPVSRDAEP